MRSLDVSMADHQTGRVRDVGRAVRPRVSLGPMEPPPACGETRCAGFAFATSATRWIYEQIGREAGPDDRWIRDPRPCLGPDGRALIDELHRQFHLDEDAYSWDDPLARLDSLEETLRPWLEQKHPDVPWLDHAVSYLASLCYKTLEEVGVPDYVMEWLSVLDAVRRERTPDPQRLRALKKASRLVRAYPDVSAVLTAIIRQSEPRDDGVLELISTLFKAHGGRWGRRFDKRGKIRKKKRPEIKTAMVSLEKQLRNLPAQIDWHLAQQTRCVDPFRRG